MQWTRMWQALCTKELIYGLVDFINFLISCLSSMCSKVLLKGKHKHEEHSERLLSSNYFWSGSIGVCLLEFLNTLSTISARLRNLSAYHFLHIYGMTEMDMIPSETGLSI